MVNRNNNLISNLFLSNIIEEKSLESARIPVQAHEIEKAYLYALEYVTKDNIPLGEVLCITPGFGNENAEPGKETGRIRFNHNMTDRPDWELDGEKYIRTKATWDAFSRAKFAMALGFKPDQKDVDVLNENQKRTKVDMSGIILN